MVKVKFGALVVGPRIQRNHAVVSKPPPWIKQTDFFEQHSQVIGEHRGLSHTAVYALG